MSPHDRKSCAKRTLDGLIRRAAPPFSHASQPYWRVVTAIRASSCLLSPTTARGHTNPDEKEGVIRACVRMAKRRNRWLRPPESWVAPDDSPFMQLRSLVSHVFDRYPVPTFMTPVWCDVDDAPWKIDLYMHLAAGQSMRRFRFPLPHGARMTKRAAHWFVHAPHDLDPIRAYRWAHVRSLGGDGRLARILTMSPALMGLTEHEMFWESVIRFLVNNDPISRAEIEAIVHFVNQQRFEPAETSWGPGAGEEPLQPDFSLRGRSLTSLRRHMTNWSTDLHESLPPICRPASPWTRTNIAPFRLMLGDVLWTIDELLSDSELRVEGSIMKHCVATYIHDCARRKTSIWSMKMEQSRKRRRTLTIEVLPGSRMIWQAKGKCNAEPVGLAKRMLQRWAKQERLTFSDSAYAA